MNIPVNVKGSGLFIGMVIGAGLFALPYVVWHSGFLWSLFHFLLALGIVTTVHLLYGYVLFDYHENHRLPGYVRHILGMKWYFVSLASRLFSYFGYLLIYGVLGGIFLSNIFPDFGSQSLSILFFLAAAPFVILNPRELGTINLFLTIPLVLFVGVLFIIAFPNVNLGTIPFYPTELPWFAPIGVFLFALGGASILPEVVDIFGRKNKAHFTINILASTAVIATVYILFVLGVLGISDGTVSKDAMASLEEGLTNSWMFIIGSIIGLLAVITSYIPLSTELRFTLELDLNFSQKSAWFVTTFIPLGLFLLGINDFILVISVVGALGVGVEGMLISFLSYRVSHIKKWLAMLLSAFFICGVFLEIFGVLNFI